MADTTFIEGRSPEKARELLRKAKEAGVPTGSVRTTSDGYIVPSSLVTESAPEPSPAPVFDPAEHGVDEVKEYLENADADERDRVLTAERNGKARKSLVGNDGEEKN